MPDSNRTGVGPGTSLGRYALTEHLGGGPTGEGFRAKVYGVAGFERQFAIKRFHEELVSVPQKKQQLSKVAHNYATVVHPHIARMHEYGVFEGHSFVVVDLVAGVDVARLIKATAGAGSPLPAGALLGLVSQISRAVGYAHTRGVVHLGLCPTNVIASLEGDAKVTDFGFLPVRLGERPADDPTLETRVPYLAPEQLLGQPSTEAADVFSLAVLAYEILSGTPAFSGSDGAEIASRIHTGQLAPLPLPAPIVEALQRATRPTPSERFANADIFAKTLASAIRSARLPGTRREIAVAVKQIMTMPAVLPPSRPPGRLAVPTPSPVAKTDRADSEADTRVVNIDEVRSPPARSITEAWSLSSPSITAASPLLPPPLRTPSAEYAAPMQHDPHNEVTVQGDNPLSARTESRGRPSSTAESELGNAEVNHGGSPPLDAFADPLSVEGGSSAAIRLTPDRKPLVFFAIVVGAAVLGGGGYVVYDQLSGGGDVPVAVDATLAAVTVARTDKSDAAIALWQPDAASASGIDADQEQADAGEPDATTNPPAVPGELVIKSDPKRAYVYLDGAYKGKTPIELPATADKHKLALLRKGYKLHRADIDGRASLLIKLRKAPSLRGRGKIKVRCKPQHSRRYYIIVDGRDSGLLCPASRVKVGKGEHKIEIYDAVTDSTQTHDVIVKDTRRSVRLRVEED